jgi:hypothetical protein
MGFLRYFFFHLKRQQELARKVSLPFGSVKKWSTRSSIAIPLSSAGAFAQEFADDTADIRELRRRVGCNCVACIAVQAHQRRIRN